MSNRLKEEVSPYLLLHADQEIDWYPWGEEAFERARKEEKPVFLSIGYSTCHWCHVMAKESFSDPEVTALLNRYFISVKVDREERPDVDDVYMTVCQSLTGSGGWPLSIFLTPDQKPFFAGTYFPKNTVGRRLGFLDLLRIIAEKWRGDEDELRRSSEEITAQITGLLEREKESADADPTETGFSYLWRTFDRENGGFGGGAKFPTPQKLLFLEEYAERTGDKNCLMMIEKTLDAMARGGLYDAVGGGFFRYATDIAFRIPHFEKMLRDNALLIPVYAYGSQLTGNTFFLDIAEDTAAFLLREMRTADGTFHTARDADTNGEEGGYYLFSKEEITDTLGAKEAERFFIRRGIEGEPSLNGKFLPYLKETNGFRADPSRAKMRRFREARSHLFTDEKVLTSWNGMTAAAFAALYRVSGSGICLETAEECFESLLNTVFDGSELYSGHKNGRFLAPATIDDYAWLIFACLQLYEASLNDAYLRRAETLFESASAHFYDPERGGFYTRNKKSTPLIFALKETDDTDSPSANGIMAENARLLSVLSDCHLPAEILAGQKEFMARALGEHPYTAPSFLRVLSMLEEPPQIIRCVAPKGVDLSAIAPHIPLRSLILRLEPSGEYPLLKGETTYYVCEADRCLPPRGWEKGEETPWRETAALSENS
ncbi:MAG: thioredoxin domain-containing protein [Bacillota bacterium]|jgi:uncharacterized protein YyaL (SSP411 family)